LVIPKSQIVTSGMPYEAQIVLAAVDSTKQPDYYLGETLLKDNMIVQGTSGTGDRSVSGKVMADGETYPFEAKYSVTESSATIAPTLMKFLYEVIDNDLEIAMPGVPSGAVSASLKGSGNIKLKEKNIWTVTDLDMATSPTVTVSLTANVGGRSITESKDFTVRPLPDPTAFISYKDANGRTQKFFTGRFSKRSLMEATGIEAAIDDGLLNIPHTVTGFTLRITDNRGISVPEPSNSGAFTARQKDLIKNMSNGTRFYISDIKALDPRGRPLNLKYAMEVVVN